MAPVEPVTPFEPVRQAIVGGRPDPGHPAVGVLRGVESLCTGTSLSPRVVVTAAHCIVQEDPFTQFTLGPSLGDFQEQRTVLLAERHPDYEEDVLLDSTKLAIHDIALVILKQPVSVSPASYRTEDLQGEEGSPLLFVGFGNTDPFNDFTAGTKQVVDSSIGSINPQGFWNFTSAEDPKNTCKGDSGGPGILGPDGEEEIVGLVSSGDPQCKKDGFNTRIDIHADWLAAKIEEYESWPADPCGDGICDADEQAGVCPEDCQSAEDSSAEGTESLDAGNSQASDPATEAAAEDSTWEDDEGVDSGQCSTRFCRPGASGTSLILLFILLLSFRRAAPAPLFHKDLT